MARRLTGNFPQALTHIALINTVHNLSDARRRREAGDAEVEIASRITCESIPALRRDASLERTLRGHRSASITQSHTIALAQNPSFSFDAVTWVACALTSSVALPIAKDMPLVEHGQIVLHVADGGDCVGRNIEALSPSFPRMCPCPAGRGDVEIIALRTHSRRLAASACCIGDFATRQLFGIGTDADDFAGRSTNTA